MRDIYEETCLRNDLDTCFREHSEVCSLHHKDSDLRNMTTVVLGGSIESRPKRGILDEGGVITAALYRQFSDGEEFTLARFTCQNPEFPEGIMIVTRDEVLIPPDEIPDTEELQIAKRLLAMVRFDSETSAHLASDEQMFTVLKFD